VLKDIVPTEKNLLGVCLQDNKNFKILARRLTASDFLIDAHRRIYQRMEAMLAKGQGVDAVTLGDALEQRSELNAVGGNSYLHHLDDGLPRHYKHIPEWVNLIAEASLMRQLALENERFACAISAPGADGQGLLSDHKARLAVIQAQRAQIQTEPMFIGSLTFAAQASTTTDWLLEGVIPRAGNGIIGGDPKATKSFAATDLGISLSCGANWMGFNVSKRVKVAVVSREDDEGLTRRRMRKLLAGNSKYQDFSDAWHIIDTRAQMADFKVTTEAHMDKLIGELGDFGAELVVLDVFRVLHDKDENDNTEVAEVLRKVTRIQSELQCATLLVHHIAKSENANPFKGLRGASCIHGWMEFGMAASVMNPEDERENFVRRLQFESKECSTRDVFYRIVESPDHASCRLEQQLEPQQPRRGRAGKVASILSGDAKNDTKSRAAGE
jgi:hypothetical protein